MWAALNERLSTDRSIERDSARAPWPDLFLTADEDRRGRRGGRLQRRAQLAPVHRVDPVSPSKTVNSVAG